MSPIEEIEAEEEINSVDYIQSRQPVDYNFDSTISLSIPLLIRMMEYAKEDAKTDMDLHRVTENVIKLSQLGKTLLMADYNKIIGSTEELNEGRYSQFKRQTEVIKPSNQINIALKEVFKRLKEVNKVASYTKQLKNELSESNDIAYTKRSEAIISKLMQETASLYKNLKELKNGKSKN